MNILFLVHVEEMFRDHFPDSMYVNRLIRACTSKKYQQVYVCVSHVMDHEPIPEITRLGSYVQIIDWGWGYHPWQFDHDIDEQSWVIPALGHEYTWIPPELRTDRFQNDNVFIGGGCESECLQDWSDILDYLRIRHEKIRGYVY